MDIARQAIGQRKAERGLCRLAARAARFVVRAVQDRRRRPGELSELRMTAPAAAIDHDWRTRGVGPELTVQALRDAAQADAHFTVLGDAALLDARGGRRRRPGHAGRQRAGVGRASRARRARTGGQAGCRERPVRAQVARRGDRRALAGRYDAIVTAPLQKSTINDAGVPFTGHTEYLAERTHTPRVAMMLAGTGHRPLRVALATTHLPLKDVSAALTVDDRRDTRDHRSRPAARLRSRRTAHPRDGPEPARGRNGYLGREEIDVISPALARANAQGIGVRPVSGRHAVPATPSRGRRLRARDVP